MADDSRVSEKPVPHYIGHRERLRERAAAGGLATSADYEVLELYLFRSAKMGDVKPKAKALLARFGSLGAVLSASLPELMSVSGIGEVAALDLKLVHEMAQRIGREPAAKRTVISSWSALLSYVRVALQHEPREQVRVLYLDRNSAFHRPQRHGTSPVILRPDNRQQRLRMVAPHPPDPQPIRHLPAPLAHQHLGAKGSPPNPLTSSGPTRRLP